ncbi:uncharacterized protein [Musca autumnalis]|uniref:uncharacterized protein n=1 Tax=Musca autumnalis TaxID=221902 RepID=UPI003CF55CDF
MKILLNICLAFVALQLVLAAPRKSSTTAISSTYQQRYQLFDLILLKTNKIISNEILVKFPAYPNILKDYTAWLKENKQKISPTKLQSYEDLKTNLQEYIKAAEAFPRQPTNCELQRKVHKLFYTIKEIRFELKDKEVNQIWSQHVNKLKGIDEEAAKNEFLTNDFPLIVKAVEIFIANLDKVGKKDNQDIIDWFNVLQSKTTDDEKIEAFESIEDLYEEEYERETNAAGKVNCRLTVQLEWREDVVKTVVMAIASLLNPELGFQTD